MRSRQPASRARPARAARSGYDTGVHVGAPCHERQGHHGGGPWGGLGLNPFFAEGPFELWVQRIEAYRRPQPDAQAAPPAPSGAAAAQAQAPPVLRNEWTEEDADAEPAGWATGTAVKERQPVPDAVVAAADAAAEAAARAAAGAAAAAQAAEAAEATASVAAAMAGRQQLHELPAAPPEQPPSPSAEQPPQDANQL